MNTTKVENVLSRVIMGKNVTRDDLREVGKDLNISNAPRKDELESDFRNFMLDTVMKSVRPKGPVGRPPADKSKVLGYKVKIGLRYAKKDGTVVNNMSEGDTFDTKEEGNDVVKTLVENKIIKVWGDHVRAKFLPRYAAKK